MSSSPTGQSRIKLATLHKGMGIRRDNLHDFLGEWPARWHLHTEDDATVRAHLACWVNETLDDLASSQHRTVGRVAYNTAWDMDLRDMMYEARLRRLQELAGINEYTAKAAVRNTISRRVVDGLARRRWPADRISAESLRDCLDREHDYHRRPRQNGTPATDLGDHDIEAIAASARFRQAVRGLLGTSLDNVIELFLPLRCHVPGTTTGLLVANTPAMGCVVYAFTSVALLHEYRHATSNSRMANWTKQSGRALVERVRRLPLPVDIVVDPVAGAGSDMDAMLILPASVIAMIELAGRPRNGN